MAECCIQVFCRIRPLSEIEKRNGSSFIAKFNEKDTVIVGGKPYVYDQVFDPSQSQEGVYKQAAYHIVQDVLSGYNGTVFAYGQTSSGKTHTMEGVIGDDEKQGIIPRIINDIFNHIYKMPTESDLEFRIKISYFEIYNERIRDLLDETKTNLPIHEDRNRVPYVKGVTEQFVSTPEEVLMLIDEGKKNRQVANTNMNEYSSRSHSVFQIQVEQENRTTQKKLVGKLYLVDLAGSEKVSKTGAEGSVLEEAKNINKSLSALGNVISALADGTKAHVPYRDSKLTRILQESLGGNSRTTIIICCSPASYNEAETKSTLLFGQRAKTIKNVVVVNEELTAEEWKRRFERERDKVGKLRQALTSLENELKRWRSGDHVPDSEWSSMIDVSLSSQMGDSMMTSYSVDSMFNSPDKPPQMPMLSSRVGAMTDDERRKYEEERSKLYQQLDEKDDEIQVTSQLAERQKQQLQEQEEAILKAHLDNENLLMGLNRSQEELAKSKEATEEVFSAIQELALSLDQKKEEAAKLSDENEKISVDIDKKNLEMVVLNSKLEEMREHCNSHRKRFYDGVHSMVKDLADIGGENYTLPDKYESDANDSDKLNDELMTHARILVSKLNSDFKSSRQKLSQLENESGDVEKRLESVTKELADTHLQLQQLDTKNRALQEAVESQEKQKRQLEDDVDQLNAKLTKFSKSGNATAKEEEAQQQHQKLVTQLRDQIALKNGEIKKLTESLQELQLEREKLSQDYEKLKNEEMDREKRLKNLSALTDKREQAKQDLKALEETLQKEIQSLHQLRKLFTTDLAQRMRKSSSGQDNDDDFLSSPIQKQRIAFLENNLEQLTHFHKQLVKDNAELRCELPKLEKRYRGAIDRIKSLEAALRETKEMAMKDRKKYQFEVERIKEAVRSRNMRRVQIAKTIRPGQPGQPFTPGNRPQNVPS